MKLYEVMGQQDTYTNSAATRCEQMKDDYSKQLQNACWINDNCQSEICEPNVKCERWCALPYGSNFNLILA